MSAETVGTIILRRSDRYPYYFIIGKIDSDVLRTLRTELSFYVNGYERTNTYKSGDWDGREVLLYRHKNGDFFFPTGLIDRVMNVLNAYGVKFLIEDATEIPHETIGLKRLSKITLREYQRMAVESIFMNGGGVVALPTGAGKTVIALQTIYAYDLPALILVNTKELLEQWRKNIVDFFGYEPGLVGDGKREFKQITVAMVQTMYNIVCEEGTDIDYPVLICDECLPYDSMIVTESGLMPIGKIVEERLNVRVLTHTGRYQRVTGWHKIPLNRRMVTVTHERGKLLCTEDHAILTQRGWICAKELVRTDVVYTLVTSVGSDDSVFSASQVWGVVFVDSGLPKYVYDITVEDDHSFVAEGVIVHNCHRVGADTIYKVAMNCYAAIRIGLSATVHRTDGADLKIWAALGEVGANITPEMLIDQGYLARPNFHFEKVPSTRLPKSCKWHEAYTSLIVCNEVRNERIIYWAKDLVSKGYRTFVSVNRVDHGEMLAERIPGAVFLSGKDKSKDRQEMLARFREGKLMCIISTLLSEGVDLPEMEAIILAGGGKSSILAIQRVGRALRTTPDKNAAYIIDFIDTGKFVANHSQSRMETFKEYYGKYCVLPNERIKAGKTKYDKRRRKRKEAQAATVGTTSG